MSESPTDTLSYTDAYARAVAALARREHSAYQLTQKLRKAKACDDTIHQVLQELQEQNYQCDVRFAEMLVRSRGNSGRGPVRIRMELQENQISSEQIQDAFFASGFDWFEQAREVRERKYGPDIPAEYKEKARQMRFLMQRGFDSEQCRSALSS